MRLFSALVSVADEGDRDILLMLEGLDPPDIHASRQVSEHVRSAYVPTNKRQGETKHTTLAARTNSERSWARAVPRSPVISYVWPDLDISGDKRRQLAALCRRIPYFGRTTSAVLVRVADNPLLNEAAFVTPARVKEGSGFEFETIARSPYAGSLAALEQAHERKYLLGRAGDPWEIGRNVEYGRARELTTTSITHGPYTSMVIFDIEAGKTDGRHTARITHALRRAVLSQAVTPLPTLHGHHDGEVTQVAFLGLLDVGHEQASGRLIALAAALPDLPIGELPVVAQALTAITEVVAGPLGRFKLRRLGPLGLDQRRWAARPERWERASTVWETATPIVLDRHLKKGDSIADAVSQACVRAGLPHPARVDVSRSPTVRGAADMQPADTLRRPSDRNIKPYTHARLIFANPVRGPVVVGSMRHYGLGLCIPTDRPGG